MKRTAENKAKAGAAGGIEAVVKAINTHIDNAGVCESGCGALSNILLKSINMFHPPCSIFYFITFQKKI